MNKMTDIPALDQSAGLGPLGMASFAPDPQNARALRHAFGRFGTGVTIVTTMTPEGPLGMTVNSFSSISLDPALVLWAPAKSSRRHDAFAHARHFCIHILAADQIDLATRFAAEGHKFEPDEWEFGLEETPTLTGCLATFHCAHHALHDAGDHSIVLGRVLLASLSETKSNGLMFDQGRFGRFNADT